MSEATNPVIRRGQAPLLLSLPHVGTAIPEDIEKRLVSPWLARKDADWWIDQLYDFASEMDATIVRAHWSRTVIDLNRDPSGVSLYPGQATTGLCPVETFDGEPLYRPSLEPDADEIEARTDVYYRPYHEALTAEISRLCNINERVVVYDCHSIRSAIPRLFAGKLPVFNLGTNSGASAASDLIKRLSDILAGSGRSHVVDGRFKGGYITRHYGQPETGVYALQMELACRGYIRESLGPVSEANWPVAFDPVFAGPTRLTLRAVLAACLAFARG
ncbi:N-formylglutamate deformylase [Pleomorphomonas diazotrophica]|uniref:N-formylglutamate deformylase n=1 Tax=Pleomorphomonas diazotrophica TaxID=1166257 RepID=A0A1I4RML8_9HYPH|nr:N-formylglutamate deformylase [Pleomorphomonas diazotrophica]PKR87471.1 N-formylglutamate deformylase [Pleomorphomonas diazotrophica]SFM53474.1 formiminoglutamase [Pleomorphomonas diazotrophica]